MADPTTPISFGKYVLLERFYADAWSELWKAQSADSGAPLAVQRLLPPWDEDEDFVTRFIEGGRIAVHLNHPNLARTSEIGKRDTTFYLVREYVSGKSLGVLLRRARERGEPLPLPLACFVVAKLCEGLDYLHRSRDRQGEPQNLVHTGVAARNVLVSFDGEVKLLDAALPWRSPTAIKTAFSKSGPSFKEAFPYLSPEQVRGKHLDRRADLFSTGVLLYELLTGTRPFRGESDFEVLSQIVEAQPPPPTALNPRIPAALEKLVLIALAREPDDRFAHANELGDALQRFLITPEGIFNRTELLSWMRTTFAEDCRREAEPPALSREAPVVPPVASPKGRNAFQGFAGSHLPVTDRPEDYRPGDLVAWDLGSSRVGVGMVAQERAGADPRRPLVSYVGPQSRVESDVLFHWPLIAHFRYH